MESASSFGERIKGLADVEGDVRVMGWDQAARNRHFIGLNEGLLSAVGAQRMVENTPDEVGLSLSVFVRAVLSDEG